MKSKNLIRKKLFTTRKKKYFQVSSNYFNPLINFLNKKFKRKNILLSLYYPSNYEVDVLSLFKIINTKKIKTLLPIVETKEKMRFVEWKFLEPLRVNHFGMLEPELDKKSLTPNVMLVPLLAFDKTNNRLGYGKGFYDRFLNKFIKLKKKITTIGIAFSFQKYNKLPKSKFDVKLDFILTEKGIT
jgi:5-formyltetrahydrofolate cyclo-ligase